MTYLSHGINESLQGAFNANHLLIQRQSDHVTVENSKNETEEKIKQIITSAGFCPLISSNKIKGNFAFTIVPYKIPDCFVSTTGNPASPLSVFPVLKSMEKNKTDYFSWNEISHSLKEHTFLDNQNSPLPRDRWSRVNWCRSYIAPALNKGLAELLLQNIKEEYPLVELGSGIGYSLPESLSSRVIRIQPSLAECQLLRQSISYPIYQTDIEGLYQSLFESNKKISIFFALNVFDVMDPEKRKISFSQLGQLQNEGDRLLILLDTNPCLNIAIEQLANLYPAHAILPYFPLKDTCAKFSLILVPLEYTKFQPSESELIEMIDQESKLLAQGYVSSMQCGLHQLQSKLNLKVIELEAFFIEHVKQELEEKHYQANIYYHASFTTGELPEGISGIKQDLIYKSVTDMATIRQWSVTDQKLIDWLAKKGLKLPSHFNENFLQQLRENKQKIFGAEILVIEATKRSLI